MKTTVALIATVFLATSSAFAGGACCATQDGKMQCAQIYAKLNLTPDQKSKLDAFQARCEKDACTEESMDKFFSSAKEVLSPEQYAQLKSECSSMQPHTAKSAN